MSKAPSIYSDGTQYVKADPNVAEVILEDELSQKEQSAINAQLDELRFKNEKYLRVQTDLNAMLSDFLKAALAEKPAAAELTAFAVEYFAVQRKQFARQPGAK